MNRQKFTIINILALFVCLTYTNCSPQKNAQFEGTSTTAGNPMVQFYMASSELGAVQSLRLCVSGIEASGDQVYKTNLAPREYSAQSQDSLIETLPVPKGAYGKIKLTLSNGCASGKSLQMTNAHGTYSTTQGLDLEFEGYAAINGPLKIYLNSQVLVDAMAPVTSEQTMIAGSQDADLFFGTQTLACPAGYVLIPALAGYAAADFCISKYENRDAGGVPVSQPSGLPWVNVSRITAQAACRALGAGYDLPTNDQWQAMARGIESVGANWGGGTVGSALGLSGGHCDGSPFSLLSASTNDSDGCIGTGEICDSSTWNSQRRTYFLPNGQVIWDVGGDGWEWVSDDNSIIFAPDAYTSQITDPVAKQKFGTAGDYTALNTAPYGHLGYAFFSGASGAILRGGDWAGGDGVAAFAVSVQGIYPGYTGARATFRCVFTGQP